MEPGMNVSHVARLHGIQPSLLFKWKKQYKEGSLTDVAAGEEVVPAFVLAIRAVTVVAGQFFIFS